MADVEDTLKPNLILSEPNPVPVEQLDGSLELEDLSEYDEDNLVEIDMDFYENLTEYISDHDLMLIASDVTEGLDSDEASRERHIEQLCDGIDNLGLSDDGVYTPFEGACTVYHPLIMENAVKLVAKAEGELLPARGPAHTQVLGQLSEDKEKQAQRIKLHLNWQLTEQMPEFYSNTPKGLTQTALFGDSFRKNFYDSVRGRPCDYMVSLDQLVVNSACESLETAERITEIQYVSENEMLRRQYSGQYRQDVDIGEPYPIEKGELGDRIDRLLGFDSQVEGYKVIEQHVYYDLPGYEHEGGVPLPYVITIEEASGEVLSIRRNWDPEGSMFEKIEWFTQYGFVPGFGFYNLGYIHLLSNFQMTLTAIMRSLIDSGAFANMQGGIKSKALRVIDDGPVAPGEFKDAEFYGQDISKLIYPFQFKEPSQTLLAMFEGLEARGQKYADSAEQVVADAANYGPVGTTMALLDASTKFFSTIFKRFHHAQKKQLRIIARLNYQNLPEDDTAISFNIPGKELRISKLDYSPDIDIIPVSDPNIPSMAHRVTMASQKLQSALQSPQIHDLREAYKQYYIALGDENYEKYLPAPKQAQPLEPMQDIQAAIDGNPIMAFPDQDHDAHISIKTAFINDPTVQAQQQVFAQAIPALQANIRHHIALRFAAQMDGAGSLGINAEQAAQEIAEFNKYKAENPLGTLDPKQLIAQAELKKQANDERKLTLQEKEAQIKAAIDMAEVSLKAAEMETKAKNERDMTAFKEAMSLVKQAFTPSNKK